MVYVYGVLVSFQIILGQVLWKMAITNVSDKVDDKIVSFGGLQKLFLEPRFYLGILFYGLATLLFIFLQSKYQYTHIQAVVVSSSLIFTFISALILFGEKINHYNLIGLILLIIGAVLVTRF